MVKLQVVDSLPQIISSKTTWWNKPKKRKSILEKLENLLFVFFSVTGSARLILNTRELPSKIFCKKINIHRNFYREKINIERNMRVSIK